MQEDADVITASAALDTVELRKARGVFFTPKPVARYIINWALRSTADHILEPSCGEASFLLAAAVDRLAELQLDEAERARWCS